MSQHTKCVCGECVLGPTGVYTWSQHLLLLFEQVIFPNQHKQPAHQLFHVTFNHAALPGEADQYHRLGGRFAEAFFFFTYADELASYSTECCW